MNAHLIDHGDALQVNRPGWVTDEQWSAIKTSADAHWEASLDALGVRRVPARPCPPWCERTDHDADRVDAESAPFHSGPTFGLITTGASGDGEREAEIGEPVTFVGAMSAAGLRKLSADALAAAAWLEAQAG